jgi:hypothetical protein
MTEYEYKAGEVIYVDQGHPDDNYYIKAVRFNAHGAVTQQGEEEFLVEYADIRPLTDEEARRDLLR